ncbi:MAG: hypothetical protein GY847_00290 [Proteobacteria bacterium]|nr:hypothetical protein [Pseudomonadota bacterium]
MSITTATEFHGGADPIGSSRSGDERRRWLRNPYPSPLDLNPMLPMQSPREDSSVVKVEPIGQIVALFVSAWRRLCAAILLSTPHSYADVWRFGVRPSMINIVGASIGRAREG